MTVYLVNSIINYLFIISFGWGAIQLITGTIKTVLHQKKVFLKPAKHHFVLGLRIVFITTIIWTILTLWQVFFLTWDYPQFIPVN